jgi:dihydrofolate reductase
MRRIRFDTATTIDGWIADEHNSLAWLFAVPGSSEAEHEIATPDATVHVMGSTTYEWLLHESEMLAHPEKWQEFFRGTSVFVFTSRSLPTPEGADVRFVNASVTDALRAIREAADDGDIWVVGGGDLAGQFLDAGALDELAVTIAPVTLGGGAPLFPRRLESDRLHLVESRAVGQFVRAVYEVRPSTA